MVHFLRVGTPMSVSGAAMSLTPSTVPGHVGLVILDDRMNDCY